MADVKVTTRELVDTITLKLTHEEAVTLLAVLDLIGGPSGSARTFTEPIYDELAGAVPGELSSDEVLDICTGSIFFEDGSHYKIMETVAQSSK